LVELRTYIFRSTARGFLPLTGDTSLWVEISPGIEINRVTDIALKATNVQPAVQVVERLFGLLEIHSRSQADVRDAGRAILEALDLTPEQRYKPEIRSSQVIRKVDAHQAQIINRNRKGSMLIADQTLFVMEVEPAGYAALAVNEAEKAAEITIVQVRPYGSYGRIWLGGEERDIMVGSEAAVRAIESVSGVAQKSRKKS